MTTLAAAMAGSIAPFQPFFNKRENKVRSIFFGFVSLAYLFGSAFSHGEYYSSSASVLPLLLLLPILHSNTALERCFTLQVCISSAQYRLNSDVTASTGPVLTSCAAYVFGLMFYATHFPECKWPGKFDYIGHSHQVRSDSIHIASMGTDTSVLRRYGTCPSSSPSSCTTRDASTFSSTGKRFLARCRMLDLR
jgi:predicted membrane channel-forming protein YqfA (hemolysin III family)